MHGEQAPNLLNDAVAPLVAIHIVIGFKMIQIAIGHGEPVTRLQLFIHAFLNRHIAGQQSQRIGVTGAVNPQIGDFLQQIHNPAHSAVIAAMGDNKCLMLKTLVRTAGNQPAGFFQSRFLFNLYRIGHEQRNRLAAV